jgi:uncharacterized protein
MGLMPTAKGVMSRRLKAFPSKEALREEGSMKESTVSAKDIVEESKRRGYLAKQLYVVFTTPVHGVAPVMENLGRHLEFQEQLEREGIMFAAGPNWTDDEKSWEGDGMVVVRAQSLVEAKEIAARDPMHKAGVRRFTVRPWLVNEGTVSVRLNYSKGTFEMA